MTELSPSAQAVLDNYGRALRTNQYAVSGRIEIAIAAALRAAVLQALPKVNTGIDRAPFTPILDIAEELEA